MSVKPQRSPRSTLNLGAHRWGSHCPHCRSHVGFNIWVCPRCRAKKTKRGLLPTSAQRPFWLDVPARAFVLSVGLLAFGAWHAIPGFCAYTMATSDQPWLDLFGLAVAPTPLSRTAGVLVSMLLWVLFTRWAGQITRAWESRMAEAVWVRGTDIRGPVR